MYKIRLIGAVFTLLLLFVACSVKTVSDEDEHENSKNSSPWLYIDEWYSSPSNGSGTGLNEWQKIEFFEVSDPMQEYAQSMLKERGIYNLGCEKAKSYTDSELLPTDKRKCFIVRSLYLIEATGRFRVEFNGTDLWVDHGSLGGRPAVMKKKALIVLLPQEPENVYVTCDMYE